MSRLSVSGVLTLLKHCVQQYALQSAN